jgi:hypothetical protein
METALWVILGFLYFTYPSRYHIATGLAPAVLAEISPPLCLYLQILILLYGFFFRLVTSKE